MHSFFLPTRGRRLFFIACPHWYFFSGFTRGHILGAADARARLDEAIDDVEVELIHEDELHEHENDDDIEYWHAALEYDIGHERRMGGGASAPAQRALRVKRWPKLTRFVHVACSHWF